MKAKILLIMIFLGILSLGAVAAGDNTTDDQYIPKDISGDEVVIALEDGHFNIPFSDGSNGYCLEYGEHEAAFGDPFIVADTSYMINNNNNTPVGNYLKAYFVYYYPETIKNPVVTQHTIWHFTDDFNGWRVNQTLVEKIKIIGDAITIPDHGTLKYNSTHKMVFSFNTFLSPYEHHQNFFGYNIFFEPLSSTCDCEYIVNNYTIYNITQVVNNITYTNVTNIINNETCYIKNDTYLNITNIINNITNIFQNIINNYVNITNNYINITKVNNTTILNNITNIVNNITNITNNYQSINNTTVQNNTVIVNNTTNIINITICCKKSIVHNETVDNATVAGATNIPPQNGFYSSLLQNNIQLKKAGFNIWTWLILLFLIVCIILIKTEKN